MNYYYIVLIECPRQRKVVSITKVGFNKNPTDSLTKERKTAYLKWLSSLMRRKMMPIYTIIDKVNKDESDSVLDYYRWQFKSWGYKLFENRYDGGYREIDINSEFAWLLTNKIKDTSIKLKEEFKNYKLLILFIKDMLTHANHSRLLDELILLTILTFIYGKQTAQLKNYTIFELKESSNQFILRYGEFYMRNFINFVQNYIDNYGGIGILDRVFKSQDPTDHILINKRLKIIQNTIGYNLKLKIQDSITYSEVFGRQYLKNVNKNHKDIQALVRMGVIDLFDKSSLRTFIYDDIFPFICISNLSSS